MNRHQAILWIGVLALSLSWGAAQAAGDAEAGKAKASGCANCHGADGKGRVPLAGKEAAYLAEQLHAFKDGTRKEMMMTMLAKKLSDQDIADLAAYYAAQ